MPVLQQPSGAVVEGAPGGDPVNIQGVAGGDDVNITGDVEVTASELPNGASTSAQQTAILAAISALAVTVGLLLADVQAKADLTENQPVTIYDSANTIPADIVSYEGGNSIGVVVQYKETHLVNLSGSNQSGTVGYMLVDLSNTSSWPHTNTNHIVLDQVSIDTNTDAAFIGDLLFGFLSNVDATNGDFHQIGVLHGERSSTVGSGVFDFSVFGMGLESDEWFGITTANDTTWQTDVNLYGPDGATAHPSGAGDFVMKLVSTAGATDISVTIVYTTR